MPAPVRALLLNAVILPFRPKKSAELYRKVWTEQGSPLTIHTSELARKVQAALGSDYKVVFGMRYKNPPLRSAVDELVAARVDKIVILPLFPQYASASTGSALESALKFVGEGWNVPAVSTVGAFYDDPQYVASVAEIARAQFDEFQPDYVLFSYHGLPEKHLKKSDLTGSWCLAFERCCEAITDDNRFCYRAQCFATTRHLVQDLGLTPAEYTTTFQSRLAGQKWIEPYTDVELPKLYEKGVRRIAVLTPSFTADCLETIEEIGIRARKQWTELGGEEFLLVPCVNSSASWVATVCDLVRKA